MNILVEINLDSESKTINHGTSDNGGSLTEELEPLDQFTKETMPSPTREDKDSRSTELLSSDNGLVSLTKELPSMEVLSETSETSQDNALMFTENPTLTTDTSSGGLAIMVQTKAGPLTEQELDGKDIHSMMVKDSKSRPE